MVASHLTKGVKFEKAGRYRIVVQGMVYESWSDRLAGMRITPGLPEKDPPVSSTLEGHLRDQTQLSGVLNSLYELHLPILLVEYLGENTGV